MDKWTVRVIKSKTNAPVTSQEVAIGLDKQTAMKKAHELVHTKSMSNISVYVQNASDHTFLSPNGDRNHFGDDWKHPLESIEMDDLFDEWFN